MKYTILVTIWIIIILKVEEKYFIVSCVCAGIHLLGLIGYELQEMTKNLTKQKEESTRQILSALNAIALDTLEQLKNK